jgi:PAS domain S-box-containing protein
VKHIKVIEQLGYNNREAKVYLTALRLGESRLTEIALCLDLPLSSTKVITEKLCKDGILTSYSLKGHIYFVAENPERLLQNLVLRESAVKDALPDLLAVRKLSRGKRYNKKSDERMLSVLRVILDASEECTLIANKDGVIQYVNFACEKSFGYSLDEVKDETVAILKSEETETSLYKEMWSTLRTNKLFQSDQIIYKKKDGTVFHVWTTVFPLLLNEDVFYVYFLTELGSPADRVYDITKEFAHDVNKIINEENTVDDDRKKEGGKSDRKIKEE